jgi:hypothetical protein
MAAESLAEQVACLTSASPRPPARRRWVKMVPARYLARLTGSGRGRPEQMLREAAATTSLLSIRFDTRSVTRFHATDKHTAFLCEG